MYNNLKLINMNKTFNMKHILLILAIIFSINIFAQKNSQQHQKTEISVEIDPATFIFRGYGFHLRIKPKTSYHLLFGMGAYAMDMPDVLVDFNKNNRADGWNVRLNQGYGLFGEYHFTEVNRKWFAGAQLGVQEYKIKKENLTGSTKYTNALLMAYGGYTWRPFNFGLYLKPWAGVGYVSKLSGSNIINGTEYNIAPISMFATLHIGFTF